MKITNNKDLKRINKRYNTVLKLPNKKVKYGNININFDNIRFDSIKEGNRYKELKLLLKVGEVRDLKLQVSFELIPKTDKYRAITYIADFTYYDKNNKFIVEDVKSVITRKNPVYRIKKRLFYWKFGFDITEV